jgi:hypothetical protein
MFDTLPYEINYTHLIPINLLLSSTTSAEMSNAVSRTFNLSRDINKIILVPPLLQFVFYADLINIKLQGKH